MWRVAVDYPNGDKVLVTNDFRFKLLAKWKDVVAQEELNEEQKNNLLMEAFSGMTRFDNHRGVSK